MVKVSIISLIYKSTKLADWVYSSVMEYTPMIHRGEAEFFFIANDASDEVISHLINKNYKFYINENTILSEEELFKKGYAMPEYIGRVYKGYNQGILHAKGERIVLINSDNYFSEDWLENLLKYSSFNTIISSQLVEPGNAVKHFFFPSALRANFGQSIATFEKEDFMQYSMKYKKTGLRKGGAFMPCLFYKDLFIYAGLYPEGNIAGKSYNNIEKSGDVALYERLMNAGIEHYTALDSIVYHLNEGEKNETEHQISNNVIITDQIKSQYKIEPYNQLENINLNKLDVDLVQSTYHRSIINAILSHDTSYIFDYFRKGIEEKRAPNINELSDMVCNINNSVTQLYSIVTELSNKLTNLLNFIAWFIPFRKLRDKFRNQINTTKSR